MPGKVIVLLTIITAAVVGTGYLLSADNHTRFSWFTNPASDIGTDSFQSPIEAVQPSPDPEQQPEPPTDNALGLK